MKIEHIVISTLFFAMTVACGDEVGGNGGGAQPERDAPLVRTDSPRCLNQRPFPVAGEVQQYRNIITNRGDQALLVRDARIVEQRRDGAFFLGGDDGTPILAGPEGEPCTPQTPCRLEFREDALLNILLEPPSAGWDRALIELDTNDPDYPDGFRFVVVAAAESAQGAEDFGDRPEELNCTCRLPLPEECQP
jgi:hypothetical protein